MVLQSGVLVGISVTEQVAFQASVNCISKLTEEIAVMVYTAKDSFLNRKMIGSASCRPQSKTSKCHHMWSYLEIKAEWFSKRINSPTYTLLYFGRVYTSPPPHT